MKVRIEFTVEVDDSRRESINQWYGRPGLATRAEVKRWYEANGTSMDMDLDTMSSYREAGDGDDER